ncbi:MAG: carbohydrate binding family 9 domain-containing protein [Flavobacteriaceae bacterium]|nr:carbohydrate binding family 9 domain-containing protein [Flavobacteriaceae bacterium]
MLVAFIFTCSLHAQIIKKKSVHATRIQQAPVIDGKLDESFWLGADQAKDFVMFKPGDGDPETDKKTVVNIAYDDEAIYFAAIMYDANPGSIPTQETNRDNLGNADFFKISINPNNDGQNDTSFLVTSAGSQGDAKISSKGADWSWNAVWESAVQLNDDSWTVEMKIPYAALRFSNTNTHTWGINIHRKIQSTNQEFTWNYIDKSASLVTQFSGEITGISNIKPPIRLSFSPYASITNTSFDGTSDTNYSVGMDLKYGINESFTLDATLIPDFGQTGYDDVVLNLGPFEQRYSEQRSFFTEGTELFGKGKLFYSRRIGNKPTGYYDAADLLGENETIDNPAKVDMLNAIKISGRTKGNLGIGIFNAITEKTYAQITNLTTKEVRKIITEPFTNYNVLVIDQQFNKTSSVSLVNTNVTREGHFRDANVTAVLFNILNKKNTHFIDGSFKMSNIRENGTTSTGLFADLNIGKSSGNHQYKIGGKKVNSNYEINDLGYNRKNNYNTFYGRYSYRIFKPKGMFDNYRINLWGDVNYIDNPNTYTDTSIGVGFWGNTTNRNNVGINFFMKAGPIKDFYEPRTGDFTRYIVQETVGRLSIWYSSDYRKQFAFDINTGGLLRPDINEKGYWFGLKPRYRFNDKLQVKYSLKFKKTIHSEAYASSLSNGDIIFGIRDSKSVINSLAASYNFSVKSGLNLTFRQYWSPVTFQDDFYKLNDKGHLDSHSYSENLDINYNIWNFDLSYSWEFAPGSQLTAIYRNSLFKSDNLSDLKFGDNLKNLFDEPMKNIVSLKCIYYLDYNNLKNWI